MKKLLLVHLAIVSVSLSNPAKAAVDAFFSGVYVGMPIEDCLAYYLSGNPPIANHGSTTWGGAPAGQTMRDFRTAVAYPDSETVLERRVTVIYRLSDGEIVSVSYRGDHFSNDDLKKLLDLNRGRGHGHLVSHLYGEYGDEEFEVTTPEQYKLENTKR